MLPNVPTSCSGRFDFKLLRQAGLLHLLSEDSFGKGAAADVTEAYEKDSDWAVGCCQGFVAEVARLQSYWVPGVIRAGSRKTRARSLEKSAT